MTAAHIPEMSEPAEDLCATSLSQTILGLLHELEASLESGQAALLARDATAIEARTREQTRLQLALAAVLGLKSTSHDVFRHASAGYLKELNSAARRVQLRSQVQLALLRRRKQFLLVLGNWMAGPQIFYKPPRAAVKSASARSTFIRESARHR